MDRSNPNRLDIDTTSFVMVKKPLQAPTSPFTSKQSERYIARPNPTLGSPDRWNFEYLKKQRGFSAYLLPAPGVYHTTGVCMRNREYDKFKYIQEMFVFCRIETFKLIILKIIYSKSINRKSYFFSIYIKFNMT